MKLKVKGGSFLSTVKTVSKALSNKPLLDILENIRFDIERDYMRLTASDLQTTVSACCPITADGTRSSFTVPAKPLAETLQGLHTSELEFDLTADNSMTISWAEGQVQLPMTGVKEWPQTMIPEEKTLDIDAESRLLSAGLEMCDFATSKDDLVMVLQGLLLDFTGKELNIVASNSRIMAIANIKEIQSRMAESFILQKRSASILSGLLPTSERTLITLKKGSATFTLQDSDTEITCRLIEGRFPSYQSVIPVSKPNTLEVNKDKLLEIWKRINGCTDTITRAIRMEVLNNAVTLSGEDMSMQIAGEESMTCAYEGSPMKINFNTQLFSTLLSNTPGEIITMDLVDPSTAVVIHDGEDNQKIKFTGIIMPIRNT